MDCSRSMSVLIVFFLKYFLFSHCTITLFSMCCWDLQTKCCHSSISNNGVAFHYYHVKVLSCGPVKEWVVCFMITQVHTVSMIDSNTICTNHRAANVMCTLFIRTIHAVQLQSIISFSFSELKFEYKFIVWSYNWQT